VTEKDSPWLGYENDDWTADVDMVVEYGTDIANEVIEECVERLSDH
jgi:uncharacterized alkaline shock family protein YloU